MPEDIKLPNQPLYQTDEGTIRFRANPIVQYLLDAGPFDMNTLCIQAMHSNWTREEQAQFAQLIGYSLWGWAELSYVTEEKFQSANQELDSSPDSATIREAFGRGYAEGLQRASELISMQLDGHFDDR